MKDKLVAILSGGDWYDASVTHLVMPEKVDLNEAKKAWDKWYRQIYCKSKQSADYFCFSTWLIKNYGARDATEKDVEIFEDEG